VPLWAREMRSRQSASEISLRVNYLPDVMSPGEGKTVKAESFSPVLANFCTNGAFLHQTLFFNISAESICESEFYEFEPSSSASSWCIFAPKLQFYCSSEKIFCYKTSTFQIYVTTLCNR
jgi:hypothetical protein